MINGTFESRRFAKYQDYQDPSGDERSGYGEGAPTYMIHSFHTPLGRVNFTVVLP
jgi:hypothetical protein